MGKQIIRLTESDLHNIVKESVNKILSEMGNFHNASPEELLDTDYEGVSPEEYNQLRQYDKGMNVRMINNKGGYYGNPKLDSYLKYRNRDRGDSKKSDMETDWRNQQDAIGKQRETASNSIRHNEPSIRDNVSSRMRRDWVHGASPEEMSRTTKNIFDKNGELRQ